MFSDDITNTLFANGNTSLSTNFKNYQKQISTAKSTYQNNQQPLARAQQVADSLMAMKQRTPMTFEWEQTAGKWNSLTMYINPERLTVQTQKLKQKQVTRGGIFYHHWGDDHWSMDLSGTTGLSGMQGILQLENLYRASGTLLKYTNYQLGGPNINVGAYSTIDFADPVSVLSSAASTTNPTTLYKIQDLSKQSTGQLKAVTFCLLQIMQTNMSALKRAFLMNTIYTQISAYMARNKMTSPTAAQYYNNVLSIMTKALGTSTPSDLVVQLAYQNTVQKYGSTASKSVVPLVLNFLALKQASTNKSINSSSNTEFQNTLIDYAQQFADNVNLNVKSFSSLDDIAGRMAFLAEQRTQALQNYMSQVADWSARENSIKSQLSGALSSTGLFGDTWTPRRIVLYYENRAFIGTFDSFSYQRSADAPLIQYDLRFTVEKTIVGTMLN